MLCQATPYEGKAPYLFVSYCHKDQDSVYPLIEQMARDSCRVWYDDGNQAGDDWLVNIEDHLEGCTAFLAFITQASSYSHNCKSEIVYALKCKKKVIPVLLDEAILPKGLRLQLSYLHQLKSADYPSAQALLHKIYETEEVNACMANGQAYQPAQSKPEAEPEKEPPKEPVKEPVKKPEKEAPKEPKIEPEEKPGKKPGEKPRVGPVPPTAPMHEKKPKTEPKEPPMKPEKKKPSLKGWLSDKLNPKKTPDIDTAGVRVEDIPGKESWKASASAAWETETQLDQSPVNDNGGFRPENIWDYESTVADPYLSKKISYEEYQSFEIRGRVPEQKRGPEYGWGRQEVRGTEPDTGGRRRQDPDAEPDTGGRGRQDRDAEPDTRSRRHDEPQEQPRGAQGVQHKPVLRWEDDDEDFNGEVTVFDKGYKDKDNDLMDQTLCGIPAYDGMDKTVFGNEDEDDGDKTVRGSFRNFALLVHPAENRVYPLRLPQTKLGRSPIKCDVTIEGNDSISKLHAEIIQINRKCYLRDIHSSNGTFVYGEKLEEDRRELTEVATFQLSDETLILISGHKARQIFDQGRVDFLMNEALPEACVISDGFVLLNRSSQWPGGTLNDKRVHRHGHARVNVEKDGIYLADETPQETNGTFLNGSRLRQGESRKLKANDCIRVGDTTLVYKTINI